MKEITLTLATEELQYLASFTGKVQAWIDPYGDDAAMQKFDRREKLIRIAVGAHIRKLAIRVATKTLERKKQHKVKLANGTAEALLIYCLTCPAIYPTRICDHIISLIDPHL